MTHVLSTSFLILTGLVLASVSPGAQAAAVSCTNGSAIVQSGSGTTTYPCSNVDFLSNMSITELGGEEAVEPNKNVAASDIWGWVDDNATPGDTTDDEYYALVALRCSTAFVKVSDPENPVLVGTLADARSLQGAPGCSLYRDIAVENNRAYIVSDHFNNDASDTIPDGGPGLQVFDLTQLRNLVPANYPVTFDMTYTTNVGNFNAHNVATYRTATDTYAVVVGATVGTNTCATADAGGPMFFDIDTGVPQFVGSFCADGYTNSIECTEYSGPDVAYQGDEICFASNMDALTIFNANNKLNFSANDLISSTAYSFVVFAQQGSLDASQSYFYMSDQQDEQKYLLPTRTLVWDVSDLDAPLVATQYLAPTDSNDHVQHVQGDYDYQSNYAAGLRILDIHDRENPYQRAFFDTVPGTNQIAPYGAWGNYLFPNGTIAVSNVVTGLFMLQPTLDDTSLVDLAVTVDASVEEAVLEQPYEYTVSVTNNGPDTADNVNLTLRLSTGGVYDSTSTEPDCEAVSQRQMRCVVGTLTAGQSAQYTVTAAGFSDAGVSAIVMASARQFDPDSKNNTADTTITLKAGQASGSSGGGSIGLGMLAGLLGIAWLTHRKRSA